MKLAEAYKAKTGNEVVIEEVAREVYENGGRDIVIDLTEIPALTSIGKIDRLRGGDSAALAPQGSSVWCIPAVRMAADCRSCPEDEARSVGYLDAAGIALAARADIEDV